MNFGTDIGRFLRHHRDEFEDFRFGPLAESARAKLLAIAEHDADRRTRLAAESAIEKLDQNAPFKGDLAKLRKELEALRKRNAELENRLKKLEAK